jgi:transcriptional regulator with XRE-family HTH domain
MHRVTKEAGAVLRLAREAAGLSLDTMARRTNFSKGYLSNVETGKRTATPDVIRAYQVVLGDDVNRRQLLMALLAGAATPLASAEVIGRAFELALDAPALAVDDWLAKLEEYGRDYMSRAYLSFDAGAIQARLAGDLAQIQTSLGQPALTSIAAKLLTIQGLTVQSTTMPSGDGHRTDALRWYTLGVRAADRSADTASRVWVRGRAALRLAVEGAELPAATCFAKEALALSERPSVGRLSALLALAQTQGTAGDSAGTRATLEDAQKTFDIIGSDRRVSDFAIPEWRMALLTSLAVSRLGEERSALQAQETAERALPSTSKYLQLHRALMMVKAGNRQGGISYARDSLGRLPPEEHRPALWLLMREIESA